MLDLRQERQSSICRDLRIGVDEVANTIANIIVSSWISFMTGSLSCEKKPVRCFFNFCFPSTTRTANMSKVKRSSPHGSLSCENKSHHRTSNVECGGRTHSIYIFFCFPSTTRRANMSKVKTSSPHAWIDVSKYCVNPRCVAWCPCLLSWNTPAIFGDCEKHVKSAPWLARLLLFAKALATNSR